LAATTLAVDDGDTGDGSAVGTSGRGILAHNAATAGFGVVGDVNAVEASETGHALALGEATSAAKVTTALDDRSNGAVLGGGGAHITVHFAVRSVTGYTRDVGAAVGRRSCASNGGSGTSRAVVALGCSRTRCVGTLAARAATSRADFVVE